MKTTAVIDGKKYKVSPYNVFETSYGLRFALVEPKWLTGIKDEYSNTVASAQIANCGFIICYHGEVIDNEYDQNEIYSMIKRSECLIKK